MPKATPSRLLGRIWRHPGNSGGRLRAVGRALGWQAWKRAAGAPLRVAFPEGFEVVCHPDSGSASNLFYFNLYFDLEEMTLLRRLLRPGDGFVDGGANIGVYALLAAALVGPSGRVVAFEPFPKHAERVRENVALNGFTQVRLVQAALTDAPGTVSFVTDRDVSNRIQTRTDPAERTVSVPATTLDLALAGEAPFAVGKLDLEGSEIAAFRGAAGLLAAASPRLWILEWNEGLFRKRGHDSRDLVRVLEEAGYVLVRPDGDRLVPAPPPARAGNLFAAHRAHLAELEARLRERPTVAPARWRRPRVAR